MTSRSDPPARAWSFPVKAYSYAIDRMRAIQARRSVEGNEMLEGWEREYSYHQFVKSLIERVDQEHQEDAARGNRGVGIMKVKSLHKQQDDDEGGEET